MTNSAPRTRVVGPPGPPPRRIAPTREIHPRHEGIPKPPIPKVGPLPEVVKHG